jgi:hypothetical protein
VSPAAVEGEFQVRPSRVRAERVKDDALDDGLARETAGGGRRVVLRLSGTAADHHDRIEDELGLPVDPAGRAEQDERAFSQVAQFLLSLLAAVAVREVIAEDERVGIVRRSWDRSLPERLVQPPGISAASQSERVDDPRRRFPFAPESQRAADNPALGEVGPVGSQELPRMRRIAG